MFTMIDSAHFWTGLILVFFCWSTSTVSITPMSLFSRNEANSTPGYSGVTSFKKLSGLRNTFDCCAACVDDPAPCIGCAHDELNNTCELYNSCYVPGNVTVYMMVPHTCPAELGFVLVTLGRCQLCLHLHAFLQTFDQALAHCHGLGANLFHIKGNVEKRVALWELLNLLGINPAATDIWLGLTDRVKEGVYRWTHDNTVAVQEELIWRTTEPNGFEDEGCTLLYMEYVDDIGLVDNSCEYTAWHVCEM